MLPEIKDQRQYVTNWKKKFSIMIETPVCFVIPQRL